MTIPLIRKRQKHSKTKSGCRTCKERRVKCDEDRPVCRRCANSGRECAGYDTPATRNSNVALRSKLELAAVVPANHSLSGLPQMPCIVKGAESYDLDYFCTKAVHSLVGADWRLAWTKLLLPMCQIEPVVVHAAVALGSLHRAITYPHSDLSDRMGPDRLHVAEIQYNKAIAHMMRFINTIGDKVSDSTAEALLVISLTLFNYDILAGESTRATLHIRNGLKVLWQQMRDRTQASNSEARLVPYRVDPRTRLDVLTHTFVRLEADMSYLNGEDVLLSPVPDHPLPASFLTVEQAQIHLDILENYVYQIWIDLHDITNAHLEQTRPGFSELDEDMRDVLVAAAMRTVDLDTAPGMQDRIVTMKKDLVRWINALSFVPVDNPNDLFRAHVEIHFWYLWVTICVIRDAEELPTDNFDEQFKHFLGKIELFFQHNRLQNSTDTPSQQKQFVKTRPGMAIGTCICLALCLIVELCRSSRVRKRGLALIRAMDMRGVYDGDFLASYYEDIVQLEEDAARQISGQLDQVDFEAHEIPEAARILECDISSRGSSLKEYYRADTGRMLYVTRQHDGELQAFERTFHVRRSSSATAVVISLPTRSRGSPHD